MSLLFIPCSQLPLQRPCAWTGAAVSARTVTRRTRSLRPARIYASTASSEQEPSPENDEAPSVLLAEPQVPKQYMDPDIGATSGVIMDDAESEDLSSPEAPKISQTALRLAAEHTEWLENLMAAFIPLPNNHPFASSAANADVRQPHPTRRMEEYRFTDMKPVYNSRYVAAQSQAQAVNVDTQIHMDDGASAVLVFIDGRYSQGLSRFKDTDVKALTDAGGYIGPLEGAPSSIPNMFTVPELDGSLKRKGHSGMFLALNTALASDCAVVDIPKDYVMQNHVVILLASSGGATADETVPSAPRVAIRAASGAKVNVIEAYMQVTPSAASETHALAVACTSVSVGDDAEVKHCIMGQLSEQSQLLAHVRADVLKRGRYLGTHFQLGGRVSRIAADILLNGPESHGELLGAAIANNRRVADLHSRIVHNSLSTTSKQLQKNIAADRARTVFSGIIIVPKGCDGADAEQLCRSLLLSDKAQVDAMPTLEIATDEVKASHGATVTDLQPDEIFYLKSRGLNEAQARALLISGFVREVIADSRLKYFKESVNPVVEKIATEYQATSDERQLQMLSI